MTVSTSVAISPDSGEHWSAPGAWPVAPGVHRIPLPLPMDGLKAVNVYVIVTGEGLTLVDGGWAIVEARTTLEAGLRQLGHSFSDIRRFLVTHVHRDHYSLARVLGTETGAHVSLGLGDQDSLRRIQEGLDGEVFVRRLASAGAEEIVERFLTMAPPVVDQAHWVDPDTWLDGDQVLTVGERTLDAVHTPGHTAGHYVFADRAGDLLFAGDHVLPTITPSIGFEPAPTGQPLGEFMASLAKVRSLPDLRLLPAHGPVAPSAHARVDELLEHHEHRLALCLGALSGGPLTSYQVAQALPWTRHDRAFGELHVFDQALATMETKAHLELLVARDQISRTDHPDGVLFNSSPSRG